MDGLKGLPWASCSSRSRSRADVAVRVVEYATKDLRSSGCMSVFASRESRGTTHRFGSVSTNLNGGLDAFRLSVRPIPPWVVGQSARTPAEGVRSTSFAGAAYIEPGSEPGSKVKGASSLVKRTCQERRAITKKEGGCTHWLQRCNDPLSSHLAVSLYIRLDLVILHLGTGARDGDC